VPFERILAHAVSGVGNELEAASDQRPFGIVARLGDTPTPWVFSFLDAGRRCGFRQVSLATPPGRRRIPWAWLKRWNQLDGPRIREADNPNRRANCTTRR